MYHKKRSNDPIEHNAEANLNPELARPERAMQRFVLHLAENGIHHDKKTNR